MDNKTLAGTIALKSGLDPTLCSSLIKEFGNMISNSCDSTHDIMIPGFGRFETLKDEEQVVTEPATGKRVLYPPVIRISFTPASALIKNTAADADAK